MSQRANVRDNVFETLAYRLNCRRPLILGQIPQLAQLDLGDENLLADTVVQLSRDATPLALLCLDEPMGDLGVGKPLLLAVHGKRRLGAGSQAEPRSGELLHEPAGHLVERADEPRSADQDDAHVVALHQRKCEKALERLRHDDGILEQLSLGNVILDAVDHQPAT